MYTFLCEVCGWIGKEGEQFYFTPSGPEGFGPPNLVDEDCCPRCWKEDLEIVYLDTVYNEE